MALEVFEEGASEVDVLRELAIAAENRGSISEANALCRAAVVLLVSHFESFLKMVAVDFIDGISTGQLESRRIPKGVRETHTLPHLEQILSSGDQGQRSSLLKRLSEVATLWTDDAKPPSGALKSSTFSRLVTSARSQVIDELYARMGSPNKVCDGDLEITDIDGEVSTTNITMSLRDVVDCRNDIAHGSSDRKPTPDDVERYSQFLKAFSARLERKAGSLVEEVTSTSL